MRYYAILSDIHANLPALEAAIAYLASRPVDRIIILGDIVGYGGNPLECLRIARSLPAATIIQGNHDRVVAGEHDPYLRRPAQAVAEWTRARLLPADLEYLTALPAGCIVDSLFFAVHGSLYHPDQYIINSRVARRNLNLLRERFATVKVAFFGHSHVQVLISEAGIHQRFADVETIELDTKKAYLINPGAVGQPRDGNPKAALAVFDVFRWSVTFVRLDYDIGRAQQAAAAAGLPPELADRLVYGL